VLEVTATLSLRASEGFTRWVWAIPIVNGYGASFVLLVMVLKRGIPVGVAYGVWSAIAAGVTSATSATLAHPEVERGRAALETVSQ
jgi:small multidrug resistance pump